MLYLDLQLNLLEGGKKNNNMKKLIKYVYCKSLIRRDPSLSSYYRFIAKGVSIGENCSFIGKNISFSSEPYLIKIGNSVRVSFDVCFVTHDGGTYVLRNENPETCIHGSIIVNDNVFIGARSIIMPNVIIGKNVIIGAGSIVTKDIPDNQVWGGTPAKFICTIDEYKKKNKSKFSYIVNEPYKEKKKILLEQFKITKS